MNIRRFAIAFACAFCFVSAGPALGAPGSEVTIATSSDGEGVAFSGRVPSAEVGQRVILQQRLKGRYRTISRSSVRGKRRAFGDLDTGPLPVGTTRRYRITSGGTLLLRPKIHCLRTPVTNRKAWVIISRGVRFVLPYPND